MTTFNTILPVVQSICDTAAQSLARFHKLTDREPEIVPESFIASYVFDRLGERISMAPETTVSVLWRWNEDAAGRPSTKPPDELKRRQRRIDLALFRQTTPTKSDDTLWALVEFKRNWRVEGDINKLNSILPLMDQCEFGIACGVVEPRRYPEWLEKERDDMRKNGEEFVISERCDLSVGSDRRTFRAFAHVFASSS